MERKLVRPHSMDEALSQREQHGMDALPIAGGQSLLVMLRNKLIDPKILLDLESIGELRGLQRQSSGVSIGAMTTFFELLSSAEVQNVLPVLAQAAAKVGSTAIRNLGTLGGNLCHNEPGADLPPALLVLNASVELRSRKATRKVDADGILSRLFSRPRLRRRKFSREWRSQLSPKRRGALTLNIRLAPRIWRSRALPWWSYRTSRKPVASTSCALVWAVWRRCHFVQRKPRPRSRARC